jgi:hypothetical protein
VLYAETRNGQRSERAWPDLVGGAKCDGRRRRNMKDVSMNSYRLSIVLLITELAFERGRRKLKEFKGLGGG